MGSHYYSYSTYYGTYYFRFLAWFWHRKRARNGSLCFLSWVV